MKKDLKKFAITGLAAIMIASAAAPFGTITAQAKKVRTVTTKAVKWQKAPAVRSGKTKVRIKKSNAYIKFTAKKAKTYRFTFSSVQPTRKSVGTCGYVAFWIGRNQYTDAPGLVNVKTKGGKTSFLKLANSHFLRYFSQSSIPKVNRYYTSRTGSLALAKGETVYLSAFFAGVTNSNISYNLTIK